MELFIDYEKCNGCGRCAEVCPVKAVEMVDDKPVIDPKVCLRCTTCMSECEPQALKIPVQTGAFDLEAALKGGSR